MNSIIHGFESLNDGKPPIITLRLQCDTDSIILSYEDNGQGMPADVIKKIFEN